MRTLKVPMKKADYDRLRRTLSVSLKRVDIAPEAAAPFEISEDFNPKSPRIVLNYNGARAAFVKGHEEGHAVLGVYLPKSTSLDVVIKKSLDSVVTEIKGVEEDKKQVSRDNDDMASDDYDTLSDRELVVNFINNLPENPYNPPDEGVFFLPRVRSWKDFDVGMGLSARCYINSLGIYRGRTLLMSLSSITGPDKMRAGASVPFDKALLADMENKLLGLWLRHMETICTFDLENLRKIDDEAIKRISEHDDGYSI